jgi:hypothetical protein
MVGYYFLLSLFFDRTSVAFIYTSYKASYSFETWTELMLIRRSWLELMYMETLLRNWCRYRSATSIDDTHCVFWKEKWEQTTFFFFFEVKGTPRRRTNDIRMERIQKCAKLSGPVDSDQYDTAGMEYNRKRERGQDVDQKRGEAEEINAFVIYLPLFPRP